jgi:hypothetical protein
LYAHQHYAAHTKGYPSARKFALQVRKVSLGFEYQTGLLEGAIFVKYFLRVPNSPGI